MASQSAFLALQQQYRPAARLLCGQFAIPVDQAVEYAQQLAALGIKAVGVDGYYFVQHEGRQHPVEVPLGALGNGPESDVEAGLQLVRGAVTEVAPAVDHTIEYVAVMPDVEWLDEGFFRLP